MRVHGESQTQILFSLTSTVSYIVLQLLNLKNNNIETAVEWLAPPALEGHILGITLSEAPPNPIGSGWRGGGEDSDDENDMLYLFPSQQNKHLLSSFDMPSILPIFPYFTPKLHSVVYIIITICLFRWLRFKVNKHAAEQALNGISLEVKLKTKLSLLHHTTA